MSKRRKRKGGPRKGVRGRRIDDRLKERVGFSKIWCIRHEQWRYVVVCLDGCPVTRQRRCERLQRALSGLDLTAECAPPRKRRRRGKQGQVERQTRTTEIPLRNRGGE